MAKTAKAPSPDGVVIWAYGTPLVQDAGFIELFDSTMIETSMSSTILNASPEAAASGGLALLQIGDRVRIDLKKGEANILIAAEALQKRRDSLNAKGGFPYPENHTPWQELYRKNVGQHASGACIEIATRYQGIAARFGTPRHSH